jgi:hypothetical protein
MRLESVTDSARRTKPIRKLRYHSLDFPTGCNSLDLGQDYHLTVYFTNKLHTAIYDHAIA